MFIFSRIKRHFQNKDATIYRQAKIETGVWSKLDAEVNNLDAEAEYLKAKAALHRQDTKLSEVLTEKEKLDLELIARHLAKEKLRDSAKAEVVGPEPH